MPDRPTAKQDAINQHAMSEVAADHLLAEQFDDLEQQREAAKLGIRVFSP